MKKIYYISGLVILALISWFGYSYYTLQNKVLLITHNVDDLNKLAIEQISIEMGGPVASSTDFIQAVYNANLQINKVLEEQQKK